MLYLFQRGQKSDSLILSVIFCNQVQFFLFNPLLVEEALLFRFNFQKKGEGKAENFNSRKNLIQSGLGLIRKERLKIQELFLLNRLKTSN
jgi:hypothetical protein